MFGVYVNFNDPEIENCWLFHDEMPAGRHNYYLYDTPNHPYLVEKQEHAEDMIRAIATFFSFSGPDFDADLVYRGRDERVFTPKEFDSVLERLNEEIDAILIDDPEAIEEDGLGSVEEQRQQAIKKIEFTIEQFMHVPVQMFTL
jgi:hypothetical protein